MKIRVETPADHDEVYALVKAAFAAAPHSDGTEADYLNGVRQSAAFLPELSLVAVEDGVIVGQIVLYKMQIHGGSGSPGAKTQLVLSPLSVRPDHFGRGIGAALIEAGCRRAAELGFEAVFLCGDPAYYGRFGFVPSCRYGIYHKRDAAQNAAWCMVKELKRGCLQGVTGAVEIE